MGRLVWPLALVLAFLVGWAAAGGGRRGPSAVQEVDQLRQAASQLRQQVEMLQARLRAREEAAGWRPSGATGEGGARRGDDSWVTMPSAGGSLPATAGEERGFADRPPRAGGGRETPGGASPGRAAPQQGSRGATGPPPTVEAALERFYRYLELTGGSETRDRWRAARELVDDLRGMGDAAAQALLHVLGSGGDSEERRAAARLLGTLQVPEALPLLRDIIEREDDLLLRRAAASGLRQLQTPESVSLMERILANPAEDRFVRLSAAYGLAESRRPLGVRGLAQIFEESTADGRGRELAFRALSSLNDERPLPFMRQLVTSQAEPAYRLRAIQYLSTQGDRQALGALQVLMNSPKEQPSIRDAAAQAYAAIAGK